jgi:antitoxin (DNA-binding transcriptional repressor) of toxin-antitoxin stability system
MNTKQLVRLALVLVVALLLWGAAALASKRNQEGTAHPTLLPRIDTSAVDSVVIIGPRDSAVLVRALKGANGWVVNGKPTDQAAVADLLKGLADTAQSPELVAQSPASHARLRVSADSGRRVRIVQHGRTVADLIAGKQTLENDGIYLRRAGAPEVYVLRSGLASALGRSADDWRNHTIAGVVPDSVSAIQISRGAKSYSLKRQGSQWVFASGAAADSAKVAELLSSYRELKASGFGSSALQDSLRNAKPKRTARLLNRQGHPLLSFVVDSTASGMWLRINSDTGSGASGEAYRLESWTADQLTPADTTLRKSVAGTKGPHRQAKPHQG